MKTYSNEPLHRGCWTDQHTRWSISRSMVASSWRGEAEIYEEMSDRSSSVLSSDLIQSIARPSTRRAEGSRLRGCLHRHAEPASRSCTTASMALVLVSVLLRYRAARPNTCRRDGRVLRRRFTSDGLTGQGRHIGGKSMQNLTRPARTLETENPAQIAV